MRAISFRSVLSGIATKLGLEPDVNFQANVAASLTEYINVHLAWAIEKFWWPELEIVERRAFRPSFDSVQTYAPGAEIYNPADDKYYQALQSATGIPVSDPAYWKEAVISPWLDMKAPGLPPIHQVRTVSARDPREHENAGEFNFTLSGDRIYLRGNVGSKVWICYITTPTQFSVAPYDATAIYSAGEVIYDHARGSCFSSVQDENLNQPVTNPAWWSKVEFPWVLSTFVKKAAYADALREDGQNEKAQTEEGRARDAFEDACETIVLNQGQARRLGVAVRK